MIGASVLWLIGRGKVEYKTIRTEMDDWCLGIGVLVFSLLIGILSNVK